MVYPFLFRKIGYLPDVPEFYTYMTPREYLRFCGEIAGLSAREINPRVDELLQRVGLAHENKKIKGFSRGMKQRLGIAQSLMGKPMLLICDEPTSALDPLGRKELLDILVASKDETTIMFSTHILSDVERICDRIAFLHQGKLALSGSICDIKKMNTKEEYEVVVQNKEDISLLQMQFHNTDKMDDYTLKIHVDSENSVKQMMQFYKNIPMALVVMLLLFGGILTNELQKGTLIPVLTKGLSRWKVLFAKGINLILIWTGGYWLCYGITYFYSDYYWDNSIMSNLFFTAFCYWLFGTMIMALMTLFSAMTTSFGGVVLGVGVLYFAMTLLGMIPKIASYLPTYLTATSELLADGNTGDYVTAITITLIITIGAVIAGCMVFNKREL